jgi:phage protein D
VTLTADDIRILIPYFAFRYRAIDAISVGGNAIDIIDVVDATNPYLTLKITDAIDDKSDDFTLEIYDPDRRWRGELYPEQGETFEIEFGWRMGDVPIESATMVFKVDSFDSNLREIITLKGVATPPLGGLRTRNDRTWEAITLQELFEFFASEHGLELIGEIDEIEYDDLTQENQTDLEFLATEAAKHDHLFKIEGNTRLVVFKQSELDAADAAFTLTPQDFMPTGTSYSDRLTEIYGKVRVKCENPDTDESIAYEITATGLPEGESFEITEQGIDNREQAIKRGEAALRKKNADKITLNFGTIGSTRYQAGLNFDLTGAGGVIDGRYQLTQVTHTFSRGEAWKTQHTARRLLDLGEITVTEIELPPEEEENADPDPSAE